MRIFAIRGGSAAAQIPDDDFRELTEGFTSVIDLSDFLNPPTLPVFDDDGHIIMSPSDALEKIGDNFLDQIREEYQDSIPNSEDLVDLFREDPVLSTVFGAAVITTVGFGIDSGWIGDVDVPSLSHDFDFGNTEVTVVLDGTVHFGPSGIENLLEETDLTIETGLTFRNGGIIRGGEQVFELRVSHSTTNGSNGVNGSLIWKY